LTKKKRKERKCENKKKRRSARSRLKSWQKGARRGFNI
jgi:hypothetical protein